MPIVTIKPNQYDDPMRSAAPNTNYGGGGGPRLEVGDWAGQYRGCLTFDMSSVPPGSQVVSALMYLYQVSRNGALAVTVNVYRILRNWGEMTCTWNNYDGVNPWQVAGCGGVLDREATAIGSYVSPGGDANGVYKLWTLNPAAIEAMVAGAFPNRGFLLKAAVEVNPEYREYGFRHDVAGLQPYLVINYIAPLGRLPAYIVDGLQGGITLKATVEQFANETWVRHTPVGGALTRTPAAHSIDLASQAKFGRKDQPLQGGAASVTIADQISDTYLSFQSTPNMPDITLAPGTIIKDQNGNVVPQEEIRPNNWMLIENLALPTGAVFSSLTANPSALFIEEVAYDETSGLGITAGRDRFTQALVARIAGRGGG